MEIIPKCVQTIYQLLVFEIISIEIVDSYLLKKLNRG